MCGRLTLARGSTCTALLPGHQCPPGTFLSIATSFLLVTERAMVRVALQEVVLQEELLKSAQTDMTSPRMQCIAEFSYLRKSGDECDHSEPTSKGEGTEQMAQDFGVSIVTSTSWDDVFGKRRFCRFG